MNRITPIGHTAGNGAKRRALDQKGIQDVRALPDLEFDRLWESVILPPGIKDRLLAQGVLSFTARGAPASSTSPIFGQSAWAGISHADRRSR